MTAAITPCAYEEVDSLPRHAAHLALRNGEPVALLQRAVRRMVRAGFELGPEVELPTRRAQLAFLRRAVFESAAPA